MRLCTGARSVKGGVIATYVVEPFLCSIYSRNEQTTAFPPTRDIHFLPFNIYDVWLNVMYHEGFYNANATRVGTKAITGAAIVEGQTAAAEAPLYPNNAIFDAPIEQIFLWSEFTRDEGGSSSSRYTGMVQTLNTGFPGVSVCGQAEVAYRPGLCTLVSIKPHRV
ncbi:hypothetical protein NLJ89_g4261 [Agrocybe chaxingu]|uniref:Uncharacterized protein n=1 Tax=Agrocybe chaxingu TaxID=84603 RepID=A0A9W8K309_9AGAR|nr:hypothetical protein NLJ89_g4261 [Agrocybe chaxingu]